MARCTCPTFSSPRTITFLPIEDFLSLMQNGEERSAGCRGVGIVRVMNGNVQRSGAQGVEGGSGFWASAPSRPSFPGQSFAHGPGWAGYDGLDKKVNYVNRSGQLPPIVVNYPCLYIFVLAMNTAMTTVAPAASSALMKAAEDCPVVMISSITTTLRPRIHSASICT